MEPQSPLLHPQGRETFPRAAISEGARVTLRWWPARAGLTVLFLAGAAWFVALASYSGSVALGVTPAHGSANALAAVLLTPAVAVCAWPLLDACFALVRGPDGAERWTRIGIEAGAALIFACLATVISAALWPGVAVLVLATALGFVAGFLRWQPAKLPGRGHAGLPLLLLLIEEQPPTSSATHPVAAPVPSEGEAA